MTILEADFILTCNKDFEVLTNSAICFDEKILDLGKPSELKSKYKSATFFKLPKNSIILPGLINPHVHLEFSTNKTLLEYGSFIPWLQSVIKNRDDIMSECSNKTVQTALTTMLKSGTTSIGAISSYGNDLEECVKSQMRVVFFNEILGSSPDSVDILFADFKQRLKFSRQMDDKRFTTALSIHSPYSIHPILAKNALDIARHDNLLVSTHFMESQAEREWLDSGSGEFLDFFKAFSPYAKPLTRPLEYLELFKGCKTLFTHCVQTNDEELAFINSLNGHITHCPRSNRLLGVGTLDANKIEEKNINLTIGTDGLSSNTSLNLWDELRSALYVHENQSLPTFAQTLLQNATKNGALALGLNSGELSKNKEADIITATLPQHIQNKNQIALQAILHVKSAECVYIQGERVAFN